MTLYAMLWALDAPAETPMERLTLLLYADGTNEEGYVRHTVRYIAERAVVSEADIQAALEALAARGVFTYDPAGAPPPPFEPWRLNVPQRMRYPDTAQPPPPPPPPPAPTPPPPRRTALYRQYDADGALLYVGISAGPGARFDSHSSASPWWPYATRAAWQWFPDLASAEEAEVAAIQTERPLFNGTHAPPDTAARRAAYLQRVRVPS